MSHFTKLHTLRAYKTESCALGIILVGYSSSIFDSVSADTNDNEGWVGIAEPESE